MQNKKQIPFRYPEELEEDFKELFKLQWYSKKKNKALIHALNIASAVIKKHSKEIDIEDSSYEVKNKLVERIKKDLKIDIYL